MTELEIAWLAGLLEGEGCFYFNRTPKITLSMTDKDVVDRAGQLMFGKSPALLPKRFPNRKDVYRVEVHGEKAVSIMDAVYPLMGARRKSKIEEVKRKASARNGVAFGERQGHSKLTNAEAVEIFRQFHASPNRGMKTRLAKTYGVTSRTIGHLVNGKSWRMVTNYVAG